MLTRWTPALALVMLAITAMLWVWPLLDAVRGDHNRGERIFLAAVATALAVPFLWVCWRVPKVLRGMGVEIDAEGIHPFDGKRTATIAWHEIAAVGFGAHASVYRGATTRRLDALEIYLADTADAANHHDLGSDWHRVAPPEAGLSAGCYRFTVPPYGPAAARVESAVRRYRPQAWRATFTHPAPGQRGTE